MDRRKRTIGIALLLLLVLLVGGCGLWVRGQQRQYALNRQLIEALVKNDGKRVFALVNEGADPNTPYAPTPVPSLPELVKQLFHRSSPPANDSPTAFLVCCGKSWIDAGRELRYGSDDAPLVQAMLKHGADANAKNRVGQTALMYAVDANRQRTVDVLLEHGADVNAKDQYGWTPLMVAAEHHVSPDGVRLLLEHKANVNAKADNGRTSLMVAALDASPDVVRLLLQSGADANAKDNNGQTPLMLAKGPPPIVALLRNAGGRK